MRAALIAAVLLVLAGCGATKQETATSPSATTAAPTSEHQTDEPAARQACAAGDSAYSPVLAALGLPPQQLRQIALDAHVPSVPPSWNGPTGKAVFDNLVALEGSALLLSASATTPADFHAKADAFKQSCAAVGATVFA